MAQTTLNYLQNRNLFSTHYLESLIYGNPEWNEDVKNAFNQAKKLYDSRKSWSHMDESMLEEFLIRPLLKQVLGHHFIPQAKVELSAKRPDYAFFQNDVHLNEALVNKGTDDIYLKAIAVGDAKSWKTSLDKKVKGARGSFEFQNPSYQIDEYLRRTPVQWGILTNGHFWRIYHKETSYKLDSYYEIDLVTILEKNDVEGFKYFYLFFRLNAFIKDASGKNFLERVKEGSVSYAKKLEANLQENIYKAMKILSEGFFEWNENGLLKNEHDLKEVQDNTLKLLYRLLFIFYAESLKLLDRDNPEYKKLSLLSIKSDIAKKIDNRELILPITTEYWNKLNTIFALINEGSESENFKIPKDLLYIPAYNGGLFDQKRNIFLHNKKIGDAFLAKAIDLMAREGKDFIDYSTLGTRQLGSIYEGLLEYKLKVAEEDLVAVKEKGYERWITKKDTESKKTFDEIKAGAIYLATDKGERKATGSYYTPDYIVKYIVRNTLEPILDEKRAAWKEKGLGEHPFLHDILSIRVLDPAMGSGHFLVEACEFLANRLVEAWGEAKPEELESVEVAEHDVHWARREIVRHCIFGVDLNPMAVELAKLSLWLETVAANKPLTFLDHHLKVGNSLIGAKVVDLKKLPSKERKESAENGKKPLKAPTIWDFTVEKHFEELLVKYGEFAAHPDDDLKSVKQKEQEYDVLQKSELNRRLHELANIWVSSYFGAAPPPDEYAEMQNEMNLKDFPDWSKWRGREWFAQAQRLAGEKRFFHWELEFPEIFYEKGAPKENPGWDAVVGNPPYLRIQELNNVDPIQVNYFNLIFQSSSGNYDIYALFIERGLSFLNLQGYLGYILPHKFFQAAYGEGLRELISKTKSISQIVNFRHYQIFSDSTTYTCLMFLSKVPKEKWKYIEISSESDLDLINLLSASGQQLEKSIIGKEPWVFGSNELIKIMNKIKGMSLTLEEVTDRIFQGLKTSADNVYILEVKDSKESIVRVKSEESEKIYELEKDLLHPLIKGGNLKRYGIKDTDKVILFPYTYEDNNLRLLNEKEIEQKFPKAYKYLLENKDYLCERERGKFRGDNWYQYGRNQALDVVSHKKIITPDFAEAASFSYDTIGDFFFTGGAAGGYGILVKKDFSYSYILSLLNSKLIDTFHHMGSTTFRGGWYSYESRFIKQLPIRRISFTTPPDRRAALAVDAKALYSEFLSAPGADNLDGINRIDRINASNPVNPVQKVVSLSAAPDSQKILEFIGARLSAAPEESDVVHDLLAHLAERMIEMNKEKNAEIKGFLRWFEGEIGAPIEELTNKTAIKEYYEAGFDALAGALAKNKKKLKEGYDPTRREPKEKLQAEFNTSVGKLAPLLKRIEANDGLIDAIVYKLYGLTEEEIKIVEGSISGKKGELES